MSTIQGSNRLRCDHCEYTYLAGMPGSRHSMSGLDWCSAGCLDAWGRAKMSGKIESITIQGTVTAPGRKDDTKKLRYDLLPAGPLAEVVKVLTFGAAKYWDDNWQKIEAPRKRYTAAMMRHVESWRAGERNDPESGAHHLAHATCCALFLIWGDDKWPI